MKGAKRRSIVMAVALLLQAAALVLVLLLVLRVYFQHAVAVAIVIAAALSLPGLWLAWYAYRTSRESALPPGPQGMSVAADQLAATIRAQWEREAHVRGLDNSFPLPVSWIPGDASLSEPWQSLTTLAATGYGWPSPRADQWAASPDGLAGTGSDLLTVLAAVPTGRLVVLGEPGAGKTMLMVRLVLDLLGTREPEDPVPVLLSLSSWDPYRRGFREWVAETLTSIYPGLAAAPPYGVNAPTLAAALLASRLILPVLDGLDEIPQESRAMAVSGIRGGLRPGERMVVTSRSLQYREAIMSRQRFAEPFPGAAVVELLPLDAHVVGDYLVRHAAIGPSRWAPVIAALDAQRGPVAQTLTTPLMVGLADTIYNGHPGEAAGVAVGDPAELCDPGRFPTQEAVATHLLSGYISAAYRQYRLGDRPAEEASRWLTFLARYLRAEDPGPDLAWWRLRRAAPRVLRPLAAAAAAAAVMAVAGAVAVETAGVLVWVAALSAAVTAILTGAAVALARGRSVPALRSGIRRLARHKVRFTSPETPRAVLARDRRAAISAGIGAAVLVGVVAGVVAGFFAGTGAVILAAAGAGAFAGALASFTAAVWPSYAISRVWLAVRGVLPWQLMRFLDDASSYGVLRQVGPVYQFRHAGLQEYLAAVTRPGLREAVPAGSGSVAAGRDVLGVRTAEGVSDRDMAHPASSSGGGSWYSQEVQGGRRGGGGGDGGRHGTYQGSAGSTPPVRYLRARLPDTVRPAQAFSLLVSVVRSGGAALKPFEVPAAGRQLLFIIDAPGLRVISERRQHVLVPADADSEPIKFDLIGDAPGPQRLFVTAWDGGSYLGELATEVTVERDARGAADRSVIAETRGEWAEGEVSLLVRYDPRQSAYRFEFIDVDFPGEVMSQLLYNPRPAVEQLVRGLNALAEDEAGYSAGETRDYLVNAGLRLWEELIPAELKSQFWERQDRITQLTILADHDVVPWELLYPKNPGHDAGFLVEQFPVTRAIFGHRRERRLQLHPARFVLPPGSPPEATIEAERLAGILGTELIAVSELSPLLRLIRTEPFGLLHFACHNRFSPDEGSSIRLDRPFDPTFMMTAVSDKTLAACAPMIFINACRSAGMASSYNQLGGWAENFMRAGAAAFIGSLWAVSDDAAREFAQGLYRQLMDGQALGKAVMAARQAIAAAPGDPTWLAYTVYGDPQAKIVSSGGSAVL